MKTKEKKNNTVNKKPIKKDSVKMVKNNTESDTKIIGALIIIILILLGGYIIYSNVKPQEKEYVATKDEKQFKKEYESINSEDGALKVNIIEDNNIEYITMKDASKILDDGTGFIFFGFSRCPYCRSSIETLLNAMSSSNLEKIYYVNLRPDGKAESDIRDLYELKNDKAKKVKDGEEGYSEVVTALANYLDDYTLTTEKDKKIKTGVKRLYAATVVAVRDGKVLSYHNGTVESHKAVDKKLPELTKKQKQELLDIYMDMISSYLDDTCSLDNDNC